MFSSTAADEAYIQNEIDRFAKATILLKLKPENSKAYNRKKSQAWKREIPPTSL